MALYVGLFIMFLCLSGDASEVINENSPIVEAVEGGHAAIPCNVSNPLEDDEATLILWYRIDMPNPIYTLDVRNAPIKNARHFPSDEMGDRAYFNVSIHPPILVLKDVMTNDEADYRCRVDLRRSRTLILHSRLRVIVPPNEPIIMDEHGQHLHDIVGPYDEGSTIKFICEVDGGDPSPNVTWWRGDELIDVDFSIIRQRFVRNELIINNIQREDLLVEFSCQASNTHLSKPILSTVKLDINLLPIESRILGTRLVLLSGVEHEFVCETRGSRPKALTSWWLESRKIGIGTSEVTREKGNITLSALNFIPTPEDNGKRLICKSANPNNPKSAVEDERILRVQYVPIVNLTFGTNIIKSGIREGNLVMLECSIWANPWIFEIAWQFQDTLLVPNKANGVIISNQTLVFPNIKEEHRGKYRCLASNTIGQGYSNELILKVQFTPVCNHRHPKIYGITLGETVNVTCDIEANPVNVSYQWSFNNSEGTKMLQNVTMDETKRILIYSPHSMAEYGTMYCWAKNSIGNQIDPCIIKIVPAGAPEPPHDCVITNQTTTSLSIDCEAGYNGSLQQIFHLEVYNSIVEYMTSNLSRSDKPNFKVKELLPGTSYVLVLYSSNDKGKSNSVALVASTLLKIEKKTEKKNEQSLSPILWILIGVCTIVVISILITIILIRIHVDKGTSKKDMTSKESTSQCEVTKKERDDSQESTSEKGPDIIPLTVETDVFYTSCMSDESIFCNNDESPATKYVHEKYTDTVL